MVSHAYKGSQCNFQMEWENGEITSESLGVAADDFCISLSMSIVTNQMRNILLFALTSPPSVMDLLPIDDDIFGIQEVCKILIQQAK
jgi:hypothetical protein